MKKLLIRTSLGLASALLFSGCHKEKSETPSPTLPSFVNKYSLKWQKSLGSTGTDGGKSVSVNTSDGGIIVAGYSTGNDGDVSGNHGGFDAWVAKLDGNGVLQWQKSFGGSGEDGATGVAIAADGSIIIAGYSTSNNGDVSGNHGDRDFWVAKLDKNGVLQWQKSLGGSLLDTATGVAIAADGSIIVAGYSQSTDGDVSGNHGGTDAWVVKLNGNGALQWQKALGGTGGDEAYGIVVASDGSIIVAGDSNSNNGDVSGNHGGRDVWVVKLDGAGILKWQKSLGGTGYDLGYNVSLTSSNDIILSGDTESDDGDVSSNHGFADFWVVKLDGNGALKWEKTLGGTGYDVPNGGNLVTPDGGIIVAGYSQSNDGDVSGNHGGTDFWIIKLDENGMLKWQQSFGGTSAEDINGISSTPGGDIIMTGYSLSNNGNVSGNHGGYDMWVVRLQPQ